MGLTLVATGEHYVFDVLLGWSYAGAVMLGLGLVGAPQREAHGAGQASGRGGAGRGARLSGRRLGAVACVLALLALAVAARRGLRLRRRHRRHATDAETRARSSSPT